MGSFLQLFQSQAKLILSFSIQEWHSNYKYERVKGKMNLA